MSSRKQRTALVTGGNRGLGAAIARALHDAGHAVIVTHTPRNTKAAAWLREQQSLGYSFTAYGVDVADYGSTHALARQVRADGRVVNISSINGSKGQFGQTNYSAAKAGVHGFTKALAQEVARKGITVNTVSPGYLATEMVMAVREDVREKTISAIPVGRLGDPAEVAALVAFIASDAAAFMTGSNVAMNGGQHMA